MAGFALGSGGGVTVFGLLAVFLMYSRVKHEEDQVRAEWDLVPVVVASEDLRTGELLSPKNIASRSIPRRLVTDSIVKPESAAYVLTQPILMPHHAGDPLRWTALNDPETGGNVVARQVADECTRQYNLRPNPSQLDASVEAIRSRLAGGVTP